MMELTNATITRSRQQDEGHIFISVLNIYWSFCNCWTAW